VKVKARFENCVLPGDLVVRLIAKVRQRKRIFSGLVELFVSQRKVAEIQPMLIIVPELIHGLVACDHFSSSSG
jgi:hypothetical protein